MLWQQSPSQARRGRDAHAGGGAAPVESDRDGTGEVLLPRLREDQPGAGAIPCRPPGMGRPKPVGHDHVREVRPASALEPPGRALCPGRGADRAVDHGRCRGIGLCGAGAAAAPGGSPRHGGRAPSCRRYDRAGAGQGQDRHGAVLGLRPGRPAIWGHGAAGGDVLLLPRPQGRASPRTSGPICRHPAGRRL